MHAGPKKLSHDYNATISTKNKGNHDSVVSSEKESENCFVEFEECAHIKALEQKGKSNEDKPCDEIKELKIVFINTHRYNNSIYHNEFNKIVSYTIKTIERKEKLKKLEGL